MSGSSSSSASAAAAAAASTASVSDQPVADGKQELETVPAPDGKRKRDDLGVYVDVDIASITAVLLEGDGSLFYTMPYDSKLKLLDAMLRSQDVLNSAAYKDKLGVMIMCTAGAFQDLSSSASLDNAEFVGFNLLHLVKCENDTNLMTDFGVYADASNQKRLRDEQAFAIARRLALDGICFKNFSSPHITGAVSKSVGILSAIMADDARTVAGYIGSSRVNDALYFTGPFLLFKQDTAAHIAARFGRHRVYDWLLKKGADPNAENIRGETPAELHAANGGNRGVKAARKE